MSCLNREKSMYTYEISPRIINNFWSLFSENSALINRCFNYLYKRIPDYEGKKYSFNNLIIRLYELNVFYKFSLKKIAIIEKKEHLINKCNLTKKDLIESGVNIQERWEKFIFNWIEKILKERVHINKKEKERYIYDTFLFDYSLPKEYYCYWAETDNKRFNNSKEEVIEGTKKNRRGKIFPPCFNNRLHPSEDFFDNPLDTLLAAETHQIILKNLNSKYEKDIYLSLLNGICSEDIASNLNLSISHTNKIIRNIKSKIRVNTTTF